MLVADADFPVRCFYRYVYRYERNTQIRQLQLALSDS
jgi:hypothetical protein